jgi:hypothetical protein
MKLYDLLYVSVSPDCLLDAIKTLTEQGAEDLWLCKDESNNWELRFDNPRLHKDKYSDGNPEKGV